MRNSKKMSINKSKTISLNDDKEFLEVDLNPLIKNYMIKEAFKMFDENDSGDIDKKEFKKLILTLGLEMDDKKINEMMREIDKDGSGTIDIEEFTKMMTRYQFSKDSPISQHLENAFNLYDKDGDGYISAKDIQKVGEEMDGVFAQEEADLLVSLCKHFAKNSNVKQNERGNISKEEFINMLLSVNFIEELKNDPKADGNQSTGRNDASENTSQLNQLRGSNLNLSKSEKISMTRSFNDSNK